MASDSEPKNFFIEAPSRPPQKSHFGKQKACKGRNPHKRASWKLVGNPGHELVVN